MPLWVSAARPGARPEDNVAKLPHGHQRKLRGHREFPGVCQLHQPTDDVTNGSTKGPNLSAATNSLLAITNVTVAHAGGYVAWVTNAINNFTNTRTAILTVGPDVYAGDGRKI
ncbi:MAG: hypothetical protein V9H26_06810 [Verrucomicrobiota bacterium]